MSAEATAPAMPATVACAAAAGPAANGPHDRREKAEHAGEGFRRRGQDRADHRRRLRRQRRRGAGLFGARARRDAGGRRRGLGGFGRDLIARRSPRPIR